jgi:hypothetical protein
MSEKFGNFFLKQAPLNSGPAIPQPAAIRPPQRGKAPERKAYFTKIFRWRQPNGQTQEPNSVEVVGTFSNWQKLPLGPNGEPDSWQVTIENIPGHRTHHYMLLVDGQPVYDPNNDGLAIPQGSEETRYQFATERGPRVFMLFAQSK